MATLDTLQDAVDVLTASTTSLLAEVNVNKSTLTTSATSAGNSATNAAASASTATTQASNASASASAASSSASDAASSAAAASAISLANEPVRHSVRPSLLLDFANTKQLDPRITFTRASTGTFYDGKTVAKAEENLLVRSQEFDNASWTKLNSTVTANAVTSPDGTTTAEQVTLSSQYAYILQNVTGAINGATYTGSIWVQSVSGNTSLDLVLSTNGAYFQSSVITVSGTWTRYTVTVTNWNSTYGLQLGVQDRNASGQPTVINVWGAQLEQRSSVTAYTATTTAPITNYIPALQSAAAGVARFEHNPTTGESLGLEIEEQRTNLQLNSELFTSNWSGTRTNISSTTIVAPSGALTGSKLYTDSTASNTHLLTQSGYFITATGTITLSVYAKAAELSKIGLREGASTGSYATFNLTTGAVISQGGSGASGAITNVGNGWYRVSVTLSNTGNTTFQIFLLPDTYTTGDPQVSFNGNGWAGLYIWGAQAENGAFATSYIPTVASQVTRSADSASMTGANFSSWYRADEGSIYLDAVNNASANDRFFYQVASGTWNNAIDCYTAATGTRIEQRIILNGTVPFQQLNNLAVGSSNKFCLAYKTNDTVATSNGTAGTTDTSVGIPVLSYFVIGGAWTGGAMCGTIKKLAFYGKRLTNAEVQSITVI